MQLSIIVPVFNDAKVIDRLFATLEPFRGRPDVEILIIDDASTDDSVAQIKKHRLRFENLELIECRQNGGPSKARNFGMDLARGEYLAFLDSDDAWHPQKIELQIALMRKYGAKISGTRHAVCTEESWAKLHAKAPDANLSVRKVGWPNILFRSPFATPSVILHNSLRDFRFAETLRYCEDYHLWLRITRLHPAIKIEYPLTFTFKGDFEPGTDSLSSRLWLMQKGLASGYLRLFQFEALSFGQRLMVLGATAFSFLKFLRRLALLKRPREALGNRFDR